ncbi:MAG: thymidylate kinase [Oscillospiraceae bacterium]|nr:thymidylate kinase [Oscillospiraceae bacterium]MCL2278053.1 thymidylate kinase [Oscillospiraceae bacterium]
MGKLIVFEGIDGSGKSTQFKLMCERLKAEGRDFRRVQFPRYDEPSSALIKMYLSGDFGKDPGAVNAYAASSFYAVDRFASFVMDWQNYYESGGLILTDRYTTSNALHQGAKMAFGERKNFFEWLYDHEFDRFGLPRPDMVLFMSIDASLAANRLRMRETETGTDADIHENNLVYLAACAESGNEAAAQYGWSVVECARDGHSRSENDIHNEVYDMLSRCL